MTGLFIVAGHVHHLCCSLCSLSSCACSSGFVCVVFQGCVYVKCNSKEAAGKVRQALHGWWFDGELDCRLCPSYFAVELSVVEQWHCMFSAQPGKLVSNKSVAMQTPSQTLCVAMQTWDWNSCKCLLP